jgi:hypothetical protein
MTDTPNTKVIRVAVLVTADTRLKVLSRLLDDAFEYYPEILQFAVEGYGWPGDGDPTEESLVNALLDRTADRLLEDPGRA